MSYNNMSNNMQQPIDNHMSPNQNTFPQTDMSSPNAPQQKNAKERLADAKLSARDNMEFAKGHAHRKLGVAIDKAAGGAHKAKDRIFGQKEGNLDVNGVPSNVNPALPKTVNDLNDREMYAGLPGDLNNQGMHPGYQMNPMGPGYQSEQHLNQGMNPIGLGHQDNYLNKDLQGKSSIQNQQLGNQMNPISPGYQSEQHLDQGMNPIGLGHQGDHLNQGMNTMGPGPLTSQDKHDQELRYKHDKDLKIKDLRHENDGLTKDMQYDPNDHLRKDHKDLAQPMGPGLQTTEQFGKDKNLMGPGHLGHQDDYLNKDLHGKSSLQQDHLDKDMHHKDHKHDHLEKYDHKDHKPDYLNKDLHDKDYKNDPYLNQPMGPGLLTTEQMGHQDNYLNNDLQGKSSLQYDHLGKDHHLDKDMHHKDHKHDHLEKYDLSHENDHLNKDLQGKSSLQDDHLDKDYREKDHKHNHLDKHEKKLREKHDKDLKKKDLRQENDGLTKDMKYDPNDHIGKDHKDHDNDRHNHLPKVFQLHDKKDYKEEHHKDKHLKDRQLENDQMSREMHEKMLADER